MSDTNEQKFFASLQAFVDAVPQLVSAQQKEDMKKVIGGYPPPDVSGNVAGNDPMLFLSPQEAQFLVRIQKRVSPELSDHQFFVRLAQIAHLRWSLETQAIFDAGTFLLQRGIRITPERKPDEEVINLVLDAKESFSQYAVSEHEVQKASNKSSTGGWRKSQKHSEKTSGLSAFMEAVKRNW